MNAKIKILHLEDNELDSELLVSTLESEGLSCQIHRVTQREEFITAITNNTYDLILSDNTLPEFNGLEALRSAKKIQPNTPFIFLSGTLSEDIAIEAMKWGASDYVLKHRMPKLGLTVKRVLHEYDQKKELRLAQEKIKESEEKYRIITENSADAIFVNNPNGEYVYVNPAATKLLGYSNEEFLKLSIKDLTPLEKGEEYITYFENLSQKGSTLFELQLRKKNGELIPVDLNAVILPNGMTYASCRDISVRKEAEREILNAKEKAEEMNRIKSFFLSNMSHELRTPMIAIMGYAELLQEELTDPEQLKMIDGIVEGATRLKSTIQNILELSRIECTDIRLETSTRFLHEIVEESIQQLYKSAQRKNLYLRTDILDKNILVDVDPVLFHNAIYQVVDNGIKFTKSGGVTIQIGTQRMQDQLRAFVKVSDSGVGISEDNIKKVFGEFRQVSEGFNRSFEGLGVGLNLVKKILQMIKGEISISSKIGKGTDVTISLSPKMSDAQLKKEIAVRHRTTRIEDYPVKRGNKPAILLVEDNPLNRDVINIFLKNYYNITESPDGISALVIASRFNFDAILMDINLGEGIDGIETTKRLREMDGYKNIPIIAISAYVLLVDKERLVKHGFTDYLPKPFTKEIILKMMNKIFYN